MRNGSNVTRLKNAVRYGFGNLARSAGSGLSGYLPRMLLLAAPRLCWAPEPAETLLEVEVAAEDRCTLVVTGV